LNAVAKIIATFGYTGFFPFAPATFASGIFCLLYWFVPGGEWLAHPIVVLVTLIISIPVSTMMEKDFGEDPSCVVIDEVVGMQVILVFATGVSMYGVAAAFILFRIFDIWKPYPIDKTQSFPGGWGIVIDDVLAGIYSRVALVLIAMKFGSLGGYTPW